MREEVLTSEGYEKLRAELDELKTTRRAEIAEEIKTAREFGDISENAEYDSAKHDQALLETRISTMEARLAGAKIIRGGSKKSASGYPEIGSVVNFKFESGPNAGSSHKMTLCSSLEASAAEKKLSIESPIGHALSKIKVGETATVKTPRGELKLKLTKIS